MHEELEITSMEVGVGRQSQQYFYYKASHSVAYKGKCQHPWDIFTINLSAVSFEGRKKDGENCKVIQRW